MDTKPLVDSPPIIDPRIQTMFSPKSIAVVGASTDPSKIGHALFRNLKEYGFTGRLYPINPKAQTVLDTQAYPSLTRLPEKPDLVFLAIPTQFILSLIEEAGKLGIQSVVIITAGFSETGSEGKHQQTLINKVIHKYNIRILGPNVLGIVNTDPDTKMNGIFVIPKVSPGPLAFISQSGALGNAILGFANRRNLGISLFAAIGNMADISFNDLLPIVATNTHTKVIMLYAETIPNPRRFLQLASEINITKPIVIIKSGKSIAGARATQSHTASLAGSDEIYNAAFKQYGIHRADGVDQMFDISKILAWQSPLLGKGIGIVTNSGGPGIIVADALEEIGLSVPTLSQKTLEELERTLPPVCATQNPIDLVAAAGPENYAYGLRMLLEDTSINGAIVVLTPPDLIYPQGSLEVAKAIVPIARQFPSKPVLACFMGGPSIDHAETYLENNGIPNFATGKRVATALLSLYIRNQYLQHKKS